MTMTARTTTNNSLCTSPSCEKDYIIGELWGEDPNAVSLCAAAVLFPGRIYANRRRRSCRSHQDIACIVVGGQVSFVIYALTLIYTEAKRRFATATPLG